MKVSDKAVRTAIKIAAVVFTAPATYEVAGSLYPDWSPLARLPIQIAGLVLIEGALLMGWQQLDHNDKAEPAERWLYTAITLLAYVALLYIAVIHEGWAGWIFRLTLAAVIGYSVLESGILAKLADQRRADRSVDSSRTVKRERRKLERETRKLELRSEHKLLRLEVELGEQARADELQKDYERRSKKTQKEHRKELQTIESDGSEKVTPKRVGFPYPIGRINSDRQLKKDEKLELFSEYVNSYPEGQPSDYVEWAQETFGVAESTAWSYWSELKPELEPELSSNGNGHK